MQPTTSKWLGGLTVVVALLMGLAGWADSQGLQIAIRTLMLGVSAAAIAIPIGAILAWLANHNGFVPFACRLSIVVGLFVPVFMTLSAWDAAFGRLGWITSTSGDVLKPVVPPWMAAVWVHAMASVPWVAVFFLMAHRLPVRSHEEYSRMSMSSPRAIWHGSRWRYGPVILLSLTWVVINAAREIAVTDLYQVSTLAEQVYLGYSLGQINAVAGKWTPGELAAAENLPVAVAVLVIGIMLVLSVVFFNSLMALPRGTGRRMQFNATGSRHWTVAITGCVVLVSIVLVPLFNLVTRAGFMVDRIGGQPVASWSLESLGSAMSRAATGYQTEFLWSLGVAVTSATALIAVALPLAWSARFSRVARWPAIAIVALAAAMPGPVVGNGVAKLFAASSSPWAVYLYDRTIAAPVLANVLFCLPVAFLVGLFCVGDTSRAALDAASVAGAGRFRQFFRFGVLDHRRSIFGGWIVLFAWCFGELSASQMVLPPGIDTVPRLMLGLLHAGVDETTAALTLLGLGGISVLVVCGAGLMRLSRTPR